MRSFVLIASTQVPLPHIDPIRPVLARELPRGREWTYELKLDGFRGTLYLERGSGKFLSKNVHHLRRFDSLAAGIARAFPDRDAILDGEVIVMGKVGPDFNSLMFSRGRPEYAAFDLLWLDGRDLRDLPLWRRKRMLEKLVRDTPIGYVEPTTDPALFEAAVEMDLEGIVAKRRADPYAPQTQWIKIKHRGYTQVEGRWELFDRRRR